MALLSCGVGSQGCPTHGLDGCIGAARGLEAVSARVIVSLLDSVGPR